MAYLAINGIEIPVETCEPGHLPVAGASGYSINGIYGLQRNGYVREWKVRTGWLKSDMLRALSELLSCTDSGDHWRFDVAAGSRPQVLGSTSAEALFSDARRHGYSTSTTTRPVATVESCFAADGALVYDHNEVVQRPFEGPTGYVLCEPGTTNLCPTEVAHPVSGSPGWAATAGGPTLSSSSVHFWEGSTSLSVACTTNTTIESSTIACSTTTTYTATLYVKIPYVGATITLSLVGDSSGATQAVYNFSPSARLDAWYRMSVTKTTDGSDATLKFRVATFSGTETFYYDAAQLEVQPVPTAWVDPDVNTYGAGAGVRPAGDLQYNNLLTSMINGITVACWAKHLRTGITANHYIFDVGNSPSLNRLALISTVSDVPQAIATAPEPGSTSSLVAAHGVGIDNAWHHWAVVFDPSQPKLSLYKDGTSVASDTSLSGERLFDPALITGDVHIANYGSGVSNWGPGPVTGLSVFPFAAPDEFISGLYNSGSGHGKSSFGLLPLTAHGTFLNIGRQAVKVFARLDSVVHDKAIFLSGAHQESGGKLAFTLTQAERD